MPTLTNTRHEAFAQARLGGQSVMEACLSAGFIGATPQAATRISQLPDVKARLVELHNAAGTVVAYQRMDAVRDLVTIIKARPSEVSPDHPLCEERTGRNGSYHRFPSKLRALAKLIRILGWDEPPDPEDDHTLPPPDRLTILLERIRTQDQIIPASPDAGADAAADAFDIEDDSNATPDTPLTPRQEAFVQARFSGLRVMQAYHAAGYLGESPNSATRVNQHPAVRKRLADLRKSAELALPYKKHEAANDLIAIIQAAPSEAGPENPLCETRQGPDGPCYRFPCKLLALGLLIRLLRWHQPPPPTLTLPPGPDRLDQLLEFIRTRP